MLAETIEVYAFVCKGIAGAPADQQYGHLTGDPEDSPKPLPDQIVDSLQKAGFSYWALSAEAYGEFPSVLIHIYFEGDWPGDPERDWINKAIQRLAGQALFGSD